MFLPYMDKSQKKTGNPILLLLHTSRTRVHVGRVEALAHADFARESEPLLNRECTIVYRKEGARTLSKYMGFGVNSMNKTKMSNEASWLAAAQHLLKALFWCKNRL
jgi:hypothetical protein